MYLCQILLDKLGRHMIILGSPRDKTFFHEESRTLRITMKTICGSDALVEVKDTSYWAYYVEYIHRYFIPFPRSRTTDGPVLIF
jgi:hypothetical protein